MKNLRSFVLGLVLTFGLPWLCLVVIPTFSSADLGTEVYQDADGNTQYYPESTVFANGQEVYKAEGCVQCHTQMIRPLYAGLDSWRKGWGADQEGPRPAPARPARARDYLGEPYAYLGVQRNGPDLSNVGYRLTDANAHHAHLFDPRSVNQWSTMPSFRHLYEKREIQGPRPSEDAVATTEDGFEYVPTKRAESLVRYLLSLKKDSAAPNQKTVTIEASEPLEEDAPATDEPAAPAA